MADKTPRATEAAKEAIPVEGLQTTGGQKVVAVPQEPDATPPPAQPTPDKPAQAAPAREETVANVGQLRVKTAAEKRVEGKTATKEVNALRDAKEAHRDAAGLSITAGLGTEFQVSDIKSPALEDADQIVRTRLLFDWWDGQGVFHERGKVMDLPRNEAAKLIEQGLAERGNPPEIDPLEKAVADATIGVLARK